MIGTIKEMITVLLISYKPFMLTVRKNGLCNENTIFKYIILTMLTMNVLLILWMTSSRYICIDCYELPTLRAYFQNECSPDAEF